MFGDKAPEVLISGAGPVGLFTALTLARRGVNVRIIDTGVWACAHSYALALHPQVLPLFERLGLKERVLHSSYPVHSLVVAGPDGPHARVRLDGDGDGECLAMLRQEVLEALLERALNEQGVRVEWRRRLAHIQPGSGSVQVSIDRYEKESRGYVIAHDEWVVAGSETLEVPYVIGADGYNSRVRSGLNIDFPEVGPAAYYAVFELTGEAGPPNEAVLALGDITTDVLWPLPGGECRWSFELPGYSDPLSEGPKDALARGGFGHFPTERTKDRTFHSEGAADPHLSDDSFADLIAQRAPWFEAGSRFIQWRNIVRFEKRRASSFGEGRVWLAGDSAHLTGPVGVQSMNAGLAEGYDLAVAFSSILRDGAPASILESYGQRGLANWRRLHGEDGHFVPGPQADPWIAAHAAALLSCLPATGEKLTELAGQVGLEFETADAAGRT
jgi:2-polyprenyl-6-methoxyphenol hydroxylase-like FAD-dependent oxidoreductase